MKYLFVIFFILQVFGTDIIYHNPNVEPSLTEKDGYIRMTIDNFQYLRNLGKPEIPFRPVVFLLPPDAKVKNISYEIIDSTVIPLTKPVYPSQKYLPFLKNVKVEFIEPDWNIYNSTNPYPDFFIRNFGEGKKGVFRLLTIGLYPIHYFPILNKIIIYDMRVKIEYELTRQIQKVNENLFNMHKKGVEKIVVNPDMINSYRR